MRSKFPDWMHLDNYSKSYSTPEEYAKHRTQLIQSLFGSKKAADISCGVGSQLICLCQKLKAIGIEKNKARFELAQKNIEEAFKRGIIKYKPEIRNLDFRQAKDFLTDAKIILSDPYRDKESISPSFNEVLEVFPEKKITYEFRPRKTLAILLSRHPQLNAATIEFYGEAQRCSRLTAFLPVKEPKAVFYQDDEALKLTLSFPMDEADAVLRKPIKQLSEFPQAFTIINRAVTENGFHTRLKGAFLQLDERRHLYNGRDIPASFITIFSSAEISGVSAYLYRAFSDFATELRLSIPPEEYWKFMNEHKLTNNPNSKNRLSLFSFNNIYYLAREI
ncbi:MAG TPA: hypothetical protein ENN46_04085 [Candidatus Woesearchaeota archaeon]|nr:hypothetical protein [Candidatus Woesearchaeota archaeon]